jgi:hypothetical protein
MLTPSRRSCCHVNESRRHADRHRSLFAHPSAPIQHKFEIGGRSLIGLHCLPNSRSICTWSPEVSPSAHSAPVNRAQSSTKRRVRGAANGAEKAQRAPRSDRGTSVSASQTAAPAQSAYSGAKTATAR